MPGGTSGRTCPRSRSRSSRTFPMARSRSTAIGFAGPPPPPDGTMRWSASTWSACAPARSWNIGHCSTPRGYNTKQAVTRSPNPRHRHREAGSLTLDVGQFLGHLPVTDSEEVDATHVPCAEVVAPACDYPVAGFDQFFGAECSVGCSGEQRGPRRAHRVGTDVSAAVRGGGVFEYAVWCHRGHDRVNVLGVECLVEPFDGCSCCVHGVRPIMLRSWACGPAPAGTSTRGPIAPISR